MIYEFLEWCTRNEIGIVFVGECWLECILGIRTVANPNNVRVSVITQVSKEIELVGNLFFFFFIVKSPHIHIKVWQGPPNGAVLMYN